MRWEIMETPQSSRIARIMYMEIKPNMGNLRVVFKNRRGGRIFLVTYEYSKIPREIWVKLNFAESKGKAFDELVNGIYPYKKLKNE